MATAGEKAKSTIVIKRIKKGGHAAHGAAWKIAYADFVTAMMAFFLLMWLLGSTTKGDLKGISDYFQSPLQVAMSGGSGSGDATSILPGGGEDLTRVVGQRKRGDQERRTHKMDRERRRADENNRMLELKTKVDAAIVGSPALKEFRNQIRVEVTPDGLRIQIVDDFNRPMFDLGGANVKSYMREILREIGKVLNDVDAKLALTGHTDSAPYGGGQRSYSNWELSSDRANASRRELIAGGMDPQKIVRVVGLADSSPLNKDDTRDPLNRRISIIVMNKLAEERLQKANGEIEAGAADEFEEALPKASAAGTDAAPAPPAPAPAPDATAVPSPEAAAALPLPVPAPAAPAAPIREPR